jgi:hypothetical protein
MPATSAEVAAMEVKKDQLARSIRAWSGQRQALKVGISHSATSPLREPAKRKPDKTDLTMTNSRPNPLLRGVSQRQEQFLNRMMMIATKQMVEPDGIEPTTSCLQSRRSPS